MNCILTSKQLSFSEIHSIRALGSNHRIQFPAMSMTHCYAMCLYLWRKNTSLPPLLVFLKVLGVSEVCAVINCPFHKCYRLTFIVFILAVDLYKTLLVLRFYFDYYRPDLSADLTKKSSVFYEPCNEGYLSFLAHY